MKVAVCIIATGNYKSLLNRLITDIHERFLINHKITIHVFHDNDDITTLPIPAQTRLNFAYHQILSYKFPEATLLRYRIMTSIVYRGDYIFYLDADMGIVSEVGDEILSDITAVRHPGFIDRPCNSWEENQKSNAFIPKEKRGFYFAGGFQGGETTPYYFAMMRMREWIKEDLSKGITPRWHDESIWNRYLSEFDKGVINVLNCDYCMPEAKTKRIAWGINNIEPKILALEKDFKFMRQ